MVMTDTMPLAQVKAHLSEVIDRVVESHERVIVTRHGQREAVVIAVADLESLEDTLDLLSDPEAMKEITVARAAAARGEGIDAQTLRERYLHARG